MKFSRQVTRKERVRIFSFRGVAAIIFSVGVPPIETMMCVSVGGRRRLFYGARAHAVNVGRASPRIPNGA